MGTYRLSEEAKDDLIAIHQFGVRAFGERQADAYFWQIIQRLKVLAETPNILHISLTGKPTHTTFSMRVDR